MRIGISPYGSDRAATLELTQAAVAGGIDSFWLGDGLFRRPDFAGWRGGMESLTELAWLSGRHPGVRIGMTAAVLPVRDIDWLVREAATLDQVTEGNFVLAVTAGFWADELAYRGIEPGARGQEFRRRLTALRTGLAGNQLSPEPYTPSGPPVWLAGERVTMRLAARLGLPFQASRATPGELEPVARDWAGLGGGLLGHRIYLEAGPAAPDGEQVARHTVTGSAEQLLAELLAFRDLGVGDLSMVLGHDDASAMRGLDVLLSDLLSCLPSQMIMPIGSWIRAVKAASQRAARAPSIAR
jgi:alkanesulfonate monooxygenase SsuD/methylene tetrahydromethanopterin reductase-like flavin-dependent oxidoreductase (luciferase family)